MKVESCDTGKSIVSEKSLDFAIRIINLYNYLKSEKQEYILSRQILKSGTSIGANCAESKNAQSVADFISKHSIALKEAGETKYWLKLLVRTGYITERQFGSMYTDCAELEKLLTSIIKTTKRNNKIE